jgi:hypothetical protein
MDYTIYIYSAIFGIGFTGLIALRELSVKEAMNMGPLVGISTIVQKFSKTIGVLGIFIISILKEKWYTPFLVILVGFILGAAINKIFKSIGIMNNERDRSDFGLTLSSIFTLVGLSLMYIYYFRFE